MPLYQQISAIQALESGVSSRLEKAMKWNSKTKRQNKTSAVARPDLRFQR